MSRNRVRRNYYVRAIVIWGLVQVLIGNVGQAQDFNSSIGNRDVLGNIADVPIFPWFPDGHISILAEPDNKGYIMYWSEYENYRTYGAHPFPEFHFTRSPEGSIFGGRRNIDRWDNGGSWLMSVFRQSRDTLVGFYHAEDHWDRSSNPEGIAWKSLARTSSFDNGVSWSEGEQIIISASNKPATPTWGGAGDNCVIWDSQNKRWLCYYQEHWLMMAVSYDEEGRAGTWYKYFNGEFSQPGLGGLSTAIPGLRSVPGGNPSVHYNTYLEEYVMVWHSWTSRSIYISFSADGVDWTQPRLLESPQGARRAWYPTIIGESDINSGKVARLYYADIAEGFVSREFVSKAIVFDKEEEYQPQTSWQLRQLGDVRVLGLMDKAESGRVRIVAFDGSLDSTENIEYYYTNKEGDYIVSGKFQLDNVYNQGSIGLAVRSGLSDTDAMAAIILSKDSISFRSRSIAGNKGVHKGQTLTWQSDIVWFQIEKSNETLTSRYSSDGENWQPIGSIPFAYMHSKPGLFSIGSPDRVSIAYAEMGEVTGVIDPHEDHTQHYFSNPSVNQVFIKDPENFTDFFIYHINGKLLLTGPVNDNLINVQSIMPGLYVLHLQGKKSRKSISGKLVIAR